jgi:hypothetical protein
MTENKRKILEMLAENKISADDAYRLLNTIDPEESGQGNAPKAGPAVKAKPKYLRVTVTPSENQTTEGKGSLMGMNMERVNIRVPLSLIRAGLKLTSLIPSEALDKANSALKEKGINFDVRSIKNEDIEELIEALGDMQVDAEGGRGEKVKVFVE